MKVPYIPPWRAVYRMSPPLATIARMPPAPNRDELFPTAKRKFVIGEIERRYRRAGIWPVIGTDEVGRGPLAGPVVAAAVVLKDGARLPGLDDSKLLTEEKRLELVPRIKAQSIGWSIVEGSVALIDEINILHASLWAMREAVEEVWDAIVAVDGRRPQVVLVDGNKTLPKLVVPGQKAIVKGDQRSRAIAAASVLAKVYRDDLMREMDRLHPGYGMAQHKGYPTPMHLESLKRLGPTPHHRRSFAPVAAAHLAAAAQLAATTAKLVSRAPEVHRTGRRGEDAAAHMVNERGWRIVQRNRRMKSGEADILGLRERSGLKQGLVVEVKATLRHDEDLATRVSANKRQRMFQMAEQLCSEHQLDEVHVVIIGAHLHDDRQELLWLELDAY